MVTIYVKAQQPTAMAIANDSPLSRFTHDLSTQARAGRLDPVLGRDAEIRQLVDILSRRRKNNPLVVGEAGVGKTALVEGLALRIAAGEVPDSLRRVEVRTLDLGLLQAGASVKGEFERRLQGVIDAVRQAPQPIILFIDEAHTLIGAGGRPAVRMPPTCSSRRWPVANCAPSPPPPGESTRNTSRRTRPWRDASSR